LSFINRAPNEDDSNKRDQPKYGPGKEIESVSQVALNADTEHVPAFVHDRAEYRALALRGPLFSRLPGVSVGGFFLATAFFRLAQKVALPAHHLRRVLLPIVSEVGQCATTGDHRRVERELGGPSISPLLQLQKTAPLGIGRTPAKGAKNRGMLFGGEV